MELKEGMYVRTKCLDDEGYLLEPAIAKIKDMTNYCIYLDDFGDCKEEHIIKASHNIIDLIEVGDYVNGEYVTNVVSNHSYIGISREFIMIKEKDIKSIVTKEQFSSMEYRIGE